MGKLKNSSSNRITLYQLPVAEKTIVLCFAIGLTLLSLFGLTMVKEYTFRVLSMLLVALLIDVYIFFLVFKTYLRLDMDSNSFIVRESPGFTKRKINIDELAKIEVSMISTKEELRSNRFTIDIVCNNGKVYKLRSWSTGSLGFRLFFDNNSRQRERLEEFCKKANQHIAEINAKE